MRKPSSRSPPVYTDAPHTYSTNRDVNAAINLAAQAAGPGAGATITARRVADDHPPPSGDPDRAVTLTREDQHTVVAIPAWQQVGHPKAMPGQA